VVVATDPMPNPIDKFVNNITMYRLLLYVLGTTSAFGIVLAFLGVLAYSGPWLIASCVTLLVSCFVTNRLYVRLYRASENVESSAITALILFLILFPPSQASDLVLIAFAGFIAMASKFVLAIHNRHVFNPAALAAVVIGFFGWSSGWWVANPAMVAIVAVGGLLVVRKTRRFGMMGMFLIGFFAALTVASPSASWLNAFVSWPIAFFATIMLTEPLTLPASRPAQLAEALIVGALIAVPFHFGPISSTPELALLIGNLFACAFGLKRLYRLRLVEKKELAPGMFDFAFASDRPAAFRPGQYLEWTLPHEKTDARGNRRTLSVASSPTENLVRFGVRIPENPSSFKRALSVMEVGDDLFGSNLGGEFVLPRDPSKKLAFVAGGVGITPFRSMVQDLVDRNEKRDVVILYSARTEKDFVYVDAFDRAKAVGVRTVCVPGIIPEDRVKAEIPDFADRAFYLSGPNVMVESYAKMLKTLGVSRRNVHTDYFPGY